MSPKVVIAAIVGLLFLAHPRLSVGTAGMSLSVPAAVFAAGVVVLACAVVTLLAVRALSRVRSCPHPHTIA